MVVLLVNQLKTYHPYPLKFISASAYGNHLTAPAPYSLHTDPVPGYGSRDEDGKGCPTIPGGYSTGEGEKIRGGDRVFRSRAEREASLRPGDGVPWQMQPPA